MRHWDGIAQKILASWALLLTLAVVMTGCFGPITATTELVNAEAALERARVADAHERAPHEYYTAANYLKKAKEEWGYSDFQASDRYAEKSRRAAERALTKAKEDPWTGSPVAKDKLNKARLGVDTSDPAKKPASPADILDDVNGMEEK